MTQPDGTDTGAVLPAHHIVEFCGLPGRSLRPIETMRMHRQALDVAGAKLTQHAHLMARLAERGIVIASLELELARGLSVHWACAGPAPYG